MSSAISKDFHGDQCDGIFAELFKLSNGNPAKRRVIDITSNSIKIKKHLPNVIDRSWNFYLQTHSKKGQYIMFDFKGHKVQLSGYTLKTGPQPKDNGHMQSWVIEGSNDGKEFVTINKIKKVQDLNGPSNMAHYECKATEAYRYICITMSGKNFLDKRSLLLSYIELFGSVIGDSYKNEYMETLSSCSEKDIEVFRTVFQQIDTDGNGTLDPQELSVFFRDTMPLPIKMVPLAFRVCDKQNKGAISFDEFVVFFKKIAGLSSNNPEPGYKMIFDALEDGHGAIDVNGLKEFLEYIGCENTIEDCKQVIAACDTDNDGKLTYSQIYHSILDQNAEQSGFVPKELTPEQIESIKSEFCRIDADGNGELDRDELIEFLKSPNSFGENTADLVFLLCDSDKSGTISFDEYIEFCKMALLFTTDSLKFYKMIFDALDTEKKGALPYEKLYQFFNLTNSSKNRYELALFLVMHDEDKDGYLTFEECLEDEEDSSNH